LIDPSINKLINQSISQIFYSSLDSHKQRTGTDYSVASLEGQILQKAFYLRPHHSKQVFLNTSKPDTEVVLPRFCLMITE